MNPRGYRFGLILLLALATALWLAAPSGFRSFEAFAAPSADPWPRWKAADGNNRAEIDFAAWNDLLQSYLVPSPEGINLYRYGAVSARDRAVLDRFVGGLAALPISTYNRAQQRAYWINLYNALTVKVVLDNSADGPVDSIMDINISPGCFSFGPWDKNCCGSRAKPSA